jgi:hypothetical protein
MNTVAIKRTKEEIKLQIEANHASNERTHALVVKIISWRSGLQDAVIVKNNNKISREEWSRYQKHLLDISKVQSVEVVKLKLHDMFESIKSNGGFEFPS